jgi:hypothetical protein
MDTPSLWCDIQLKDVLWDTPIHVKTAMGLLGAALDRGRTFPVNVALAQMANYPFPPAVLDMLAAHSQRWRELACPSSLLDAFAAMQVTAPRLQCLEMDVSNNEPESLDLLGAPLKFLTFPGQSLKKNMGKLPLDTLSVFKCTSCSRSHTPQALSLMSRLPKLSKFSLELYMWSDVEELFEMEFSPASSNTSSFYIQFLENIDVPRPNVVPGNIFTPLTLPLLEHLELESQYYPRFPIVWPHIDFLELSARSGFKSHLRSLQLYEVHITGPQLIECLWGLDSLERLAIADHRNVMGVGVDEHLITEALLGDLTRPPNSLGLIPQLSFLGLQTLLRFDQQALIKLAVSRLDDSDGSPNAGRFGLELSWLPDNDRTIEDDVITRFRELKISTRRRFTCRLSAAVDEWASGRW